LQCIFYASSFLKLNSVEEHHQDKELGQKDTNVNNLSHVTRQPHALQGSLYTDALHFANTHTCSVAMAERFMACTQKGYLIFKHELRAVCGLPIP
jgi:hypothetical protein